ncbi:MAG TPA: glycosyltransferase [Gammaproteobacteria bacterium]|nr:glycosyltransferase [Gammaproteobacteria bacterium]
MALKVLHLIDSGGLYGAEHMLLDLAAAQLDAGLQPVILSAGTPDINEKPLEVAARARELPLQTFRMRAGLNFRKGMEVLRFAQHQGFDILHSHGYKFNVLLGFLPWRVRKLPLLSTVHGYVQASLLSKMWLNRQIYNFSLAWMDAVVCVSEATRKDAGIFGRQAFVINNGIGLEEHSSADDPSGHIDAGVDLQDDEFVIAAFGRLSNEKGFHDLVAAFERVAPELKGTRLIVWGEGSMRRELEQLVANGRVANRVSLPGYTNQVEDLLSKVHLVVIPSYSEGLPMILLEAMKYRVPVIASTVGAMPEVLDFGGCGILVPPGDVDGLSIAIKQVWNDRSTAMARVKRARERLKSMYSSGVMEAKYRQLYGTLLR